MSFLSKIQICANFKTVQKKFTDQGIDEQIVKKYLDDFKKLKDSRDLGKNNDIDQWGKSWENFKDFVDKTKKETSKSKVRKLQKTEGAKLIAETEEYYFYHILTFEACCLYGSGTQFCITSRKNKHTGEDWNHYSAVRNIYFAISKRVENENSPDYDPDYDYKMAILVDDKGNKTFYNEMGDGYRDKKLEKKFAAIPFKKKVFDLDTEEKQLREVKKNGWVLEHIKNPSEKIQMAAVTENREVLEIIKNPSENVKKAAESGKEYEV